MESTGHDALNADKDGDGCFMCEMVRGGIIEKDLAVNSNLSCGGGFSDFFGVPVGDAYKIVVGNYTNGYECAEAVKALLEKYGYGHLLNESEESIKDQSWFPSHDQASPSR